MVKLKIPIQLTMRYFQCHKIMESRLVGIKWPFKLTKMFFQSLKFLMQIAKHFSGPSVLFNLETKTVLVIFYWCASIVAYLGTCHKCRFWKGSNQEDLLKAPKNKNSWNGERKGCVILQFSFRYDQVPNWIILASCSQSQRLQKSQRLHIKSAWYRSKDR